LEYYRKQALADGIPTARATATIAELIAMRNDLHALGTPGR
jgi:hypothetical protein